MLDLNSLDLGQIAEALADQTDYEHLWLIDPRTGDIAFWTSDTGIDGHTPVDLEDLDLLPIEPLPSHVWYRDMADFAEGITDERAGRRLARAIEGRGAFRRFRNELHEEYPPLLPAWYAFRDARAKRRAVEWLVDNSLIDKDSANHFLTKHPIPSYLNRPLAPSAIMPASAAVGAAARSTSAHLRAVEVVDWHQGSK